MLSGVSRQIENDDFPVVVNLDLPSSIRQVENVEGCESIPKTREGIPARENLVGGRNDRCIGIGHNQAPGTGAGVESGRWPTEAACGDVSTLEGAGNRFGGTESAWRNGLPNVRSANVSGFGAQASTAWAGRRDGSRHEMRRLRPHVRATVLTRTRVSLTEVMMRPLVRGLT